MDHVLERMSEKSGCEVAAVGTVQIAGHDFANYMLANRHAEPKLTSKYAPEATIVISVYLDP